MPGLAQMRPPHPGNATPASSRSPAGRSAGVWSKKQDDVGFDQLQKLWTGLSPHARQELLRVDKHMLFEQARKNLFCSRCNGLLLEGFSQIVTYGKSLQQEACARTGTAAEDESSDVLDPSVHPWGGLVASRDGILTLMDCYLRGRSLRILQNVFDSARTRERERELLYPDACGGGGRGWISHGMANHGRTHGARETCALHTSRISCDTLVDFWSALGDETRSSLFRMKEEDFIERLMYRFDSKRFCRDCRKNVVREFKELKELKRSRREPRCTAWFCAADSAFQYEVSKDKVQADWNQSFMDSACTYHHYEWAIGSGEGKTDIFAFEDVGMTTTVLTDGLELCGIDACYITVRAFRSDGRHTELSVKAHALKGKSCVHRRLVVGDGFVAITQGECIRSFFDHAEEAEDEEDDDAIDKDVNDLDSDGSRPQKHAKSPELAREFLLDAASVIFKGQVEKAFRDGTARQNAHSLFVCLALKLLEERLLVAGKEIITYEKQVKLLEEEEKEKREEEARRERRRAKERVKKLRRKERLRGKECEMERNGGKPDTVCILEDSLKSPQEAPSVVLNDGFLDNEVGSSVSVSLTPPETHDNQQSGGSSRNQKLIIGGDPNDWKINGSFKLEQPRSSRRRLRFTYNFSADQEFQWSERGPYTKDDGSDARSCGSVNGYIAASNGGRRYSRDNSAKSNARNFTPRFDKLLGHGSKSQMQCRNGYHSGNCHQIGGYRGKDFQFGIMSNHETKAIKNVDNASRLLSHGNRQGQKVCTYDVPIASKEKIGLARRNIARDIISKRQVWEPTDPRKKNLRNDTEISSVSRDLADRSSHGNANGDIQNGLEKLHDFQAPNKCCLSADSMQPANSKDHTREENVTRTEGNLSGYTNSFVLDTKPCYSKANDDEVESCFSSPVSPLNNGSAMASGTSSENCSSCISEADSIASSSTARNAEYSSTSDSEDVIQQSEGREIPVSTGNELASQEDRVPPFSGDLSTGLAFDSYAVPKIFRDDMVNDIHKIPPMGNRTTQHQSESLPVYNHGAHSYAPLPLMGYNNQHPTSWSAAANSGMVPFLRPSYMFPSPFGYNMLACQPPDYYVHYGAAQLPPNPELLVNQSPQKINSINSNEKMKHWRAVRSNGSAAVDSLNFTSDPLPMHVEKQGHPKPLTGENHMESQSKLKGDITSFSLFHFNGPVAVAPGNSLDSSPLQSETVLSDCQTKETVVEEYSLFAGSRFSFF